MKKLILKSHVLFLCATFSAGVYAVAPLEGEPDWEGAKLVEEKSQQKSDAKFVLRIEALRREAEIRREALRHEALLKD